MYMLCGIRFGFSNIYPLELYVCIVHLCIKARVRMYNICLCMFVFILQMKWSLYLVYNNYANILINIC